MLERVHCHPRRFYRHPQLRLFSLAQRLTQESFNVAAMQMLTNNYTIDNGQTGGLGILTSQAQSGAASASWTVPASGGLDGLSRVSKAQDTLINRPAYGLAQGAALVTATLDTHPVVCIRRRTRERTMAGQSGPGPWLAHAGRLRRGPKRALFWFYEQHLHRNEHGTRHHHQHLRWQWKYHPTLLINALGQTNRSQTLTWDAFDRLIGVVDRDAATNGFNWTAIYDGLGRRLRTINALVISNSLVTTLNSSNAVSTVDSWYDRRWNSLKRRDGEWLLHN